uniref:F-box/LRR-repeat protein 4-like isoform X3 n=1 Tax=Fragaria vesca subsp. vesca TaxID=101020 RepID=UPI0005C9484C|nr:PREDICTED: F-box/LRR-repeat protein 4-like isoform X3 [Fragaria vesca subsp. vesca]
MAIDAKRRSGYINSMLNDDLLAEILNKVDRKEDRKSFSEVCKQWLRVERLTRTSLRIRGHMFPLDLLTKFPNLVDFRTTRELTKKRKRQNKKSWYYPPTDPRLEFIAKTCPKLETFMASLYDTRQVQGDGHLGTKGLRALGIGCPKLSSLMFWGNQVVGNAGVDALFQSGHNLKSLHLKDIYLISDHAFRAIGSSSISILELTRCRNVTDVGLGFLANGSTSKTLKKLILKRCEGITDTGMQHLVNMRSLEHLELACLKHVTDIGGTAISTIQTLRELKLCKLWKLSERTVVALAENCRNLEVLALYRIWLHEPVTGASIHSFSRHKCLKYLSLYGFSNLDQSDVEIVLGCPSLESLVLDKSLTGNFRLMHGNSARRVVKFESFCDSFPQFMPTVW